MEQEQGGERQSMEVEPPAETPIGALVDQGVLALGPSGGSTPVASPTAASASPPASSATAAASSAARSSIAQSSAAAATSSASLASLAQVLGVDQVPAGFLAQPHVQAMLGEAQLKFLAAQVRGGE